MAAAYASGASPGEIAEAGSAMRFTDVARWTIGRMGIAGSERMDRFLRKLLKCYSFEQMRIPLGIVATDVVTGEAVIFRDRGDVVLPIRASCSYPGLFQPVRCGDRLLVDGAISTEVPALLARMLGATHVISLHLPMQGAAAIPTNMFHVINRCFQILHSRTEITWRQHSDLVIEPDVRGHGMGRVRQRRPIGEGRGRGGPAGAAAHPGVEAAPAAAQVVRSELGDRLRTGSGFRGRYRCSF